jgi:Domain of unknown function (DUF4823)
MWSKNLIALVVAATVAGCTASYSRVDTAGAERAATRLDANQPVVVAIPRDGSYEGKPYPGSGQSVAQRTAAAFAKHAKTVDIAPSKLQDRDELLGAAHKAGAGYLIIPTIAHWERRATEWSGLPSRTSIGMAVIDVSTERDLTSTLLESRSRIVSFTGTSPESLLPQLIGNYVDSLY